MMAAPAIQESMLLGGETYIPPSQSRGSMLNYNQIGVDARTIIDHFVEDPSTVSTNAAAADDVSVSHSQDKGKGREMSPSYDQRDKSMEDNIRRSYESKKSQKSPRNSPRTSPRKGAVGLSTEEAPIVPPKSPRHQTYTLPIGGGPKKVFVVSGGRRQQTTSSTRFVSASSSKSRVSAPAVPAVPEALRSPSVSSQGRTLSAPVPNKPLARSASASLDSKRVPNSSLFNDKYSMGRRRTLSSSDSEEVARGKAVERTSQLQVPALFGETQHNLGRRGTSSSIMVEGQIFEIDGEDEKSESAKTPKGRNPSMNSLHPLEEQDDVVEGEAEKSALKTSSLPHLDEDDGDSDDDDDISLHDEPAVFTDDEIDDVPPPGAYAIHPPSKNRLARAASLSLYDEDGNIVEFGTVFENRRTLVCFLRHWLCPFCQMFSQSLQHIDPLPLETAKLDLVVIGQGHWHVTKSYKEVMKIPTWVKMYSDPSRKIYKALGMTLRTNDKGPACAKPDYQTMSIFKASMIAIKKGVIDMPLRPPGDLMLLGGEFILGPGLHCSFTHRMVTTRGHLDLPRILVQAGCDLSLKTPVDPNASPRRPISTKSLDRKHTLQLARKFGRRKGNANSTTANRNEAVVARLAGDRTNNMRALSGEHKNYQTKSLSKRKNSKTATSSIRNMSISHPLELNNATPSPLRFSESAADRRPSSPDFNRQYQLANREMPPSPTTPIRAVKERLANGMVTGFSKSQSMGDMNIVFARPPRSANRPPIPTTSSSAAFAAASARTASPPASPTSLHHKRSPSMQSAGSMQSIQARAQAANRGTHQPMSSTSTTADSRQEPRFSLASLGSSQTSHSHANNNGFNMESKFSQDSQSTYLSPSNSIKRASKSSAKLPISALEASRAATFSSSSPSLPLSPSFPDPSRSKKSSIRSTDSDFGEDTEYKRLDRRMLDQPTVLFNGHENDSDEERDIPLSVSEQDVEEGSPYKMVSDLPSLSGHHKSLSQLTIEEEDDDLQKTPLARKISLDLDEQEAGNRSSIIAGDGPGGSAPYPQSLASSSTTSVPSPRSAVFPQNALFAGLPTAQQQQQHSSNGHLPSSRAPTSAPAPLFAALLAEEAARNHHPYRANGNATQSLGNDQKIPARATGASFLDDMDVHDGFVRQGSAVRDSMRMSQDSSTSYYDGSDYEDDEEEEDDWAPLRASGNVVPARLSDEGEASLDGAISPTESSSRSINDDGDSFYDDEEDDTDAEEAEARRAASSSPYELKKVTARVVNRPLTSPAVSMPRKVNGSLGQPIFKQNSINGLTTRARRLDSFQEEEEDE